MYPIKQVSSAISYNEVFPSDEKVADHVSKGAIGTGAGAVTATVSYGLGIDTYIHEEWGHALLGVGTTSEGARTEITVDVWDRFKELENESDIGTKISQFFSIFWDQLFKNGKKGETRAYYEAQYDENNQPHIHRTELGKSLGEDASDALVSVAGSLPGLALSTGAIFAGFQLKDKNPLLGYSLLSCGVVSWAQNIQYPLSAVIMIGQGAKANALPGHDFINTAECLSRMVGVDELTAAISVFGVFALLPLAAVGGAIAYKKAYATDAVSDEAALLYLLSLQEQSELKTRFTDVYNEYPGKEMLELRAQQFEETLQAYERDNTAVSIADLTYTQQSLSNEAHEFEHYMLNNLKPADLKSAKKELLEASKTLMPPETKEKKIVNGIAIGANILKTASLIATMVNKIFIHLQPLAEALNVIFPIGMVFSLMSIVSNTYDIVMSDRPSVTTKAKVLSVAELVLTVVLEAVFIAAYFTPGINGVVIPIYIIGKLITMGIAYRKNHEIRETNDMLNSLDPEQWQHMLTRLKISQREQANYEAEEKQRKAAAGTTFMEKMKYQFIHLTNKADRSIMRARQKKLKKWVSLQKKAFKLEKLDQERYDMVLAAQQ